MAIERGHGTTAVLDRPSVVLNAGPDRADAARSAPAPAIRTPDQRLRVFVSSTLQELAAERRAAKEAVERLRLAPVLFELGARPHPPRALYRAYLAQSDVFVAIYWQRYGWVAPDEDVSGLEDEYRLAGDMPRLIYVKAPAPEREERLKTLLKRIQTEDRASYKPFATSEELRELLENDLAMLLTERFALARQEPPPAAPPSTARLPIMRGRLVGRESEATLARRLLLQADVGLVTFTGPGGSGKTRLALQVAGELQEQFADGAHWVPLAEASDADLALSAIARALDVTQARGRSLLDSLKDHLRPRRALLVLDNFEQVMAAAALVAELLATCPHLKILITSRMPLHLRGERELPVLPLAVPGPEDIFNGDQLTQYAAAQLFVERVCDVRPDFDLSDDNAVAVAELCRRLDGLPLAIELAAARCRTLPPRALLARLERRLPLLTNGARDLPERQQTLRATIAWSHDLLAAPEQALFRRLAVFAGGFTLVAARAVCAVPPEVCPDELALLDTLTALTDQSLLLQDDGADGEPRFRMLATIREFAEEQLEAAGEASAIRSGHVRFFLALAEEAEPRLTGAARQRWLEQLELEHDNLRAALAWSSLHDAAAALRLAGALAWFWDFRGYFSEGRSWLESVLALPSAEKSSRGRAKALYGAGLLAWLQFDNATACARLEASVALWQELGESRGLAYALTHLGMALLAGDATSARTVLDRGLAFFRESDDRWGLALALRCLAWASTRQGSQREARAFQEEGLALYRQLGDRWGIAGGLHTLGNRAYREGDYAAARAQLAEALDTYRAIGEKWGIAKTASSLAGVLHEVGDYARARELLEESLALLRELGAGQAAAWALNGLGLQARELGDYATARARLEESLAISREAGDVTGVAWTLDRLGTVEHAVGDFAGARERFEESLRLAGTTGDRLLAAWTLHNLGCLALDVGDLVQAEAQLGESLATFRDRRERLGLVHVLAAFAALAAASGQPERALRLAGAADANAQALGAKLLPACQERLERHLTTARQALGDGPAAEALAAGLSLEDAIAYAGAVPGGLAAVAPTVSSSA